MNNNINWKRKEYDEYGRLKFEGEYINEKRNEKGKEYNLLGLLRFEGEYLNDKEWNGIRHDVFNNIIYELKDRKVLIK